jgi:hypothetical protein
MLQEYLRAEATVSARCSGAIPADSNVKGREMRLDKIVKQVLDFDNGWMRSEGCNKEQGGRQG